MAQKFTKSVMNLTDNYKERFFIHHIDRIKKERRTTEKKIGRALDYSPTSISNIKNGERRLPDHVLAKFLKHYALEEVYTAYIKSGFQQLDRPSAESVTVMQLQRTIASLQRRVAQLEGRSKRCVPLPKRVK
jgi:hypothetical protein